MRAALRCDGGLGDTLITIGATAKYLEGLRYDVTAFVKPIHATALLHLEGVTQVRAVREWDKVFGTYDLVIDFDQLFVNDTFDGLISKDYYAAVEEKVSECIELLEPLSPGRFKPQVFPDESYVFIHPGASNPNRQWTNEKWVKLAYGIRDKGYSVFWLGTSDEFGFSDERIFKLSDKTDTLWWQIDKLRQAGLFVGTDSGFAHAAAILGVKSKVLFFSTSPHDVIARYPNASGICGYRNNNPSRSLRVSDKQAMTARDWLTAGRVLNKLELPLLSRHGKLPRQVVARRKKRIWLYGFAENLQIVRDLEDRYDVRFLADTEQDIKKQDVVLILQCPNTNTIGITHDGSSYVTRYRHIEEFCRVIREISGKKA